MGQNLDEQPKRYFNFPRFGEKKRTEQEQKRSSSIFTLEVKNRVENFYDCCKIKSYLEALSAEAEAERVRRGWG